MSICYLSQLYQSIGVLTVLPEFSIGLVGAGGGGIGGGGGGGGGGG